MSVVTSKFTFVLPNNEVSVRDLGRCIDSLKVNFGCGDVDIVAYPEWMARHQTALSRRIEPYSRERVLTERNPVVFIEMDFPEESAVVAVSRPHDTYHFDFSHTFLRARVLTTGVSQNEATHPIVGSHVFSRLAPDGTDFFYYFPYGYLFRCLGLGPINEFGFRVPHKLADLVNRPPERKLVALFGGSSAWSLDCLPEETLSHQLETLLNEWAEGDGRPERYTVVNMGQHGHIVLNELLTYQLFFPVRGPDLVIAHDGFNDLAYGVYSDPGLLYPNFIAYQHNLEAWSQVLHGTTGKPRLNQPPLMARNNPRSVVQAYLTRKRQFERVVKGHGGDFIWGLQPNLKQKTTHAPLEREYMERDAATLHKAHSEAYANMPMLYDLVGQAIRRQPEIDAVFFDETVAEHGEDTVMFVDLMHTTPEGERILAHRYFNHIKNGVDAKRYFMKGSNSHGT